MRTLVNYIMSCFCKHEWELIFDTTVQTEFSLYNCKTYRCKHCGYSKKYKSH